MRMFNISSRHSVNLDQIVDMKLSRDKVIITLTNGGEIYIYSDEMGDYYKRPYDLYHAILAEEL